MADELVALKKKLYGKMDIESPMSEDEKKLNKEVAATFSAINQIIMSIRELKQQSAIDAATR